MRGNRYHNNTI